MRVTAKVTTIRGSAFLIEVDLIPSHEGDVARVLQAMLREGVWHAERTFYPYHSIYKVEVVSLA